MPITFQYNIPLFGLEVMVHDHINICEKVELVKMPAPELVTNYNEWYRGILIDSSIKNLANLKTGSQNQFFALHDIKLIVNSLKERSSANEYDIKINAEGKGGVALINISKKNKLMLLYSLFKSFIICISAYLVVLLIVAILINKKLGAFIFIGLFFGGWQLITYPTQKLINNFREVKNYERERKRFAKA